MSRLATALIVAVAAFASGSARARDATVAGTAMSGFARIVVEFDQPTKVQVRATGGVLVLGFANPARITRERLATDLPAYVSAVRRDPDDTGLRIALTNLWRPSVLEAGEKVFIDLLPPNWSGMAPGLPADIVAKLAERARAAEARLAQQGEKAKPEPLKPATLRLAILPTLSRMTFDAPPGATTRIANLAPDQVQVTFEGTGNIDTGGEKPRLAPGVAGFDIQPGDRTVSATIRAAKGYKLRSFQEEGSTVFDFAKPTPEAAPSAEAPPADGGHAPIPTVAKVAEQVTPHNDAPSDHGGSSAASTSPSTHAAVEAAKSGVHEEASVAGEPRLSAAKNAGGPVEQTKPRGNVSNLVTPVTQVGTETASLLFPFSTSVAAAAWEQAGRVTMIFDTLDRIATPPAVADGSRFFTVESIDNDSGVAVVRLRTTKPLPLRLAPEGEGWRLMMGGAEALPPDPTAVTRNADSVSVASVHIALRQPGGVHWLLDGGGQRIAVATAFGRPQGTARPLRFVEFDLPATLQGITVRAKADDVQVSPTTLGVAITSVSGLTLSAPRDDADGANATASAPLALTRAQWLEDQAGDVLARNNAMLATAASAPRSGRAEARARQAKLMLANGMEEEAGGLLALARADDPVYAQRREGTILAAIAAVSSRRFEQARALLAAESMSEDPEAALWRGLVEVGQSRWGAALKNFARMGNVLDQYPEEIVGRVRLAAFDAAMATGDLRRAGAELTAIERLPPDVIDREEHEFARARLDEAAGKLETARKIYANLAGSENRPIAARASLRGIALASRSGAMPDDEAIRKLELLTVAWRGDEVELGGMVELSRLYASGHRWREVFAQMRVADRLFPTDEMTRALHDQAGRLFETLLLSSDPDSKLSPVDALSIYFDFKELAPVGRRGDEIVRRLADRLVELDLLDQAADLLQYQVDKRLTGAARASVAAKLAAIRLMSGKPSDALATLHATRLTGLPDDVRDLRLLLEGQALADLGRVDLALEVTEGEKAPEFARLHADILWGARRWRDAGEAYEGLVGRAWQDAAAMSDRDRTHVLRAAAAYALAGETLSQGRLRAKFSGKLADSPDAKMFEQLLAPNAVGTRDFRAAVLTLSKGDALRAMLSEWRANHPDQLNGAAKEPAAPQASGDAKPDPHAAKG